MKTCIGCKQTKDFSEFSKNVKKPKGVETYCKECKKAQNKAYREKNAESLKIKKKAYAEAHREEISQKNKEYREIHREKLNEYRREWGKTHTVNRSEASKAQMRQANRDRYHNDPEFRAAKLAYEKARWMAKSESERKHISQTY